MIKVEAILQEDGVMINSHINGDREDILQELIYINLNTLKAYGRPKDETSIAISELCLAIHASMMSIPDEVWEARQDEV